MNTSAEATISDIQQESMLRIITRSFYRELVNYGIPEKDIVAVSTYLLDCMMQEKTRPRDDESYNRLFSVRDIDDAWESEKRLALQGVTICPLMPDQHVQVSNWLKEPAIRYSFIDPFPESVQQLRHYFEQPGRMYFCIFFEGKPVGVIGGSNLDTSSKKLEMRKFIGATELQGKGIGKFATFLFLYYVFCILKLDKVYIHSANTNIRNIKLNSKFGFELEGMFMDDVSIRDKKCDVVRMGLLRKVWLQIFS